MGVNIIHFVQSFHSGVLDQVFIWITNLNSEDLYIIVLPFVYWVISRDLGFRLGLVLLTAVLSNSVIKGWVALPRPSEAEGVRILYEESGGGYGFPSGHAQDATAVWGYLAARFGPARRLWYWLAGVIVFLIGLSRIYLGLHYPTDVLGGILFGLVIVAVVRWFEQRGSSLRFPAGLRWLLPFVPLVVLLLVRDPLADRMVGFIVGAVAGYLLDLQYVHFSVRASAGGQLVKLVIGYGGFFALRMLTSPLFPEGPLQVIRYGILGLWLTLVAPALFRGLGLVKSEETKPIAP